MHAWSPYEDLHTVAWGILFSTCLCCVHECMCNGDHGHYWRLGGHGYAWQIMRHHSFSIVDSEAFLCGSARFGSAYFLSELSTIGQRRCSACFVPSSWSLICVCFIYFSHGMTWSKHEKVHTNRGGERERDLYVQAAEYMHGYIAEFLEINSLLHKLISLYY